MLPSKGKQRKTAGAMCFSQPGLRKNVHFLVQDPQQIIQTSASHPTKKKDVTQSDFNDQVLETVDNIHKNVKLVDTKMNMYSEKFDQKINELDLKVQKIANRVGIV